MRDEPVPSSATPVEPLPVVKTEVPVKLALEPNSWVKTPRACVPEVVTEPPFRATTPPLYANAPCASGPLVTIVVPVVAMLDPAPLARSPSAPSPDVVTDPPLIVVCPPFCVTTPSERSPVVLMVELEMASVPPPG